MEDKKQLIQSIFADIFEKPGFDLALIEKHFHPDYQQWVNGESLDFNGFVDHMKALKSALKTVKITFEHLVEEGDRVCSIHYPQAEKNDGSHMKGKVIAFFKFSGDQLIACDELTHLLEGTDEDRDLGSRH